MAYEFNNDDHFDMKSQMMVGKIGENLFLKIYGNSPQCEIDDLRDDAVFQDKDVDFRVRQVKNSEGNPIPASKQSSWLIEVKTDLNDSGNVYVETEVVTLVKQGYHVKSASTKIGWLYGSKAKFIFYYYPATNQIFRINRLDFIEWLHNYHMGEAARRCVDSQGREILCTEDYPYDYMASNDNYGGKDGQNKNVIYHGTGLLVPIRHLITLANQEEDERKRGLHDKKTVVVYDIGEQYGIQSSEVLKQYAFLSSFVFETKNKHYTGCKMFLRVPDKYTRSTNYRTEFIRHWPPEPGNYYHCVYCGRRIHTDKMQVDHIISVDMAKKNWLARRLLPKEGVNSIKNLVPSCQRCNRRKSNYGGLWLIRGYYWRICLPIFIILRIVLIAGAIVFALMLLGVISNKPLVDFVNGIVLGFFGK